MTETLTSQKIQDFGNNLAFSILVCMKITITNFNCKGQRKHSFMYLDILPRLVDVHMYQSSRTLFLFDAVNTYCDPIYDDLTDSRTWLLGDRYSSGDLHFNGSPFLVHTS